MKAFITVIGHDTVGVVAKVAALCCELNETPVFRAVSGAGAVERGAGRDLPAGTRAGSQHKLPESRSDSDDRVCPVSYTHLTLPTILLV